MDEIMSLEDLCKYLKLSRHTIYKLTHRREIPAAIFGKRLRFRKTKIDEWIGMREALWMKRGGVRGAKGKGLRKQNVHHKHKQIIGSLVC